MKRSRPNLTETRRVLDFDIETRLIGFHNAGRFRPSGCEPLVIACGWVGEGSVESFMLPEAGIQEQIEQLQALISSTPDPSDAQIREVLERSHAHTQMTTMLEWFRERYEEATMVTGHYLSRFDLPILNMSMLEWGLKPLAEKRCLDTKTGLIEFEGISKSQENLSEMLRLPEKKYHMPDASWRRMTRLTMGGQKRGRKRVESDVRGHMQMVSKMKEREMLKESKIWNPRR